MTILSRVASQASGIAIAAFVVASMSVHDHQIVSNGASAVSRTSTGNQAHSLAVTNVSFDVIVPNIIHHY